MSFAGEVYGHKGTHGRYCGVAQGYIGEGGVT